MASKDTIKNGSPTFHPSQGGAKHWPEKESEEQLQQTNSQNIKKLQNSLQTFDSKHKNVQSNLKKLEGAKKEKDAKPAMENLNEQLKETLELCQRIEKEVEEVHDGIRKRLGINEEEKKEEEKKGGGRKNKGVPPEEQELTYELKAQLMKNVEMQNHKLKTELHLHEKMTEARLLAQQNKRLQDDATMSRANSLRLMKMFEKKAKDADAKFKDMQQELKKSQELCKKYQQLYEMERRKLQGAQGTDGSPLQSPHEDGSIKSSDNESPKLPNPSSYSFLGQSTRVNDVIRKNEVLVQQNEKQKREIQRLRFDNATLLKKAKHAAADKDALMHQFETSESNRKELLKRLEKEKQQYQTLSRSLTRQASDWILVKKQLAQYDEEYRWSQVGPVNPHSAEQRTYMHPVTKNVYRPRQMFPVDQYASANQDKD